MNEMQMSSLEREYAFAKNVARGFMLITLVLIFVPLLPLMPDVGGDPSWNFAMNQATADKLVFGKDIVFTFGPYTSVYTKVYHPGTDGLMIFGGIVLGLFHGFLVARLSRQRSIFWMMAFSMFIAAGIFSRDVLLYLYPLLLTLYIYKLAARPREELTFEARLVCLILFVPLGLLFLIKGSMLILVVGVTGLAALYFWLEKRRKFAIAICIMPVISTMFFLIIAGQPVIGFWHYFVSMITVSGGYSEAMYVDGPGIEVVLYLVCAAFILWIIMLDKLKPKRLRYFLWLSIALLLFTGFKNAFTRHDSHSLTGSETILMISFLLFTVMEHRRLPALFVFGFSCCLFMSFGYVGQNIFNIFRPLPSVFSEAIEGLKLRISPNKDDNLSNRYAARLAEIRQGSPAIPEMTGTSDIYSYEQSFLLATENKWSPRPVIQSYAVYTQKMAELNNQFLLGERAPDNIIFRLQTIDERIPALDDGLSWPSIINNYSPGNIDAGFLFLSKKRLKNIAPEKRTVATKQCRLGEEVIIGDSVNLLFAEFDLRQTLTGKLITGLYKPEPLSINITLDDGTQRKYRFISSMAEPGFVFSPFIESVDEFMVLFGDRSPLRNKVVRSFRIEKDGLGFRKRFQSWQDVYTVTLSKIVFSN